MHTHCVCEAHMHAKHAHTKGSGGMPPKKILKIGPSEIELRVDQVELSS